MGHWPPGSSPADAQERMFARKVRNGTVNHSAASLCLSCRHATIVKGESIDEEIIKCRMLSNDVDWGGVVHFKVTSCSSYDDKTSISLREMKEIAWEVRTDRVRGIGFISPEERYRQKNEGKKPGEQEEQPLYDPLSKETV